MSERTTDRSPILHLSAPDRPPAGQGGRWGLVLGGGGVLGGAWMIGALQALEKTRGLDARDASVIVGTSAGSVVAALLGCGISVPELRRHQLGEEGPSPYQPSLHHHIKAPTASSRPPRPRPLPGNVLLLPRNLGRLRRMPPTAALAGFVPAGRGDLADVAAVVEAAAPTKKWPEREGVRVVVFDYDAGRRVVLGAPQAPVAQLTEAVVASCSIPGWFAPVTIDGRRYVDGGAWSATNVDVVADDDLDEVIVLAPMVSLQPDQPSDWRARLERRWRVRVTRRCLREAARVNGRGSNVTILGPGAQDLEVIGFNLMSAHRRADVLRCSFETSLRAFEAPEGELPEKIDVTQFEDVQLDVPELDAATKDADEGR